MLWKLLLKAGLFSHQRQIQVLAKKQRYSCNPQWLIIARFSFHICHVYAHELKREFVTGSGLIIIGPSFTHPLTKMHMYVPVRRGLHCTCGLGKTHFDNLPGFHQYSTYSKFISKFLLLTVPIVKKTRESGLTWEKIYLQHYQLHCCSYCGRGYCTCTYIKILPFYDKMILYSTENTFTWRSCCCFVHPLIPDLSFMYKT